MFLHNFKYSLKTLFGDRMLIFWTFAFPIIMAFLFNMAFSNIEKNESLDIIDIAVVKNAEYKEDSTFSQIIKQLSDKKNDDRLFRTKYVSKDKAQDLLEKEKIDGYIVIKKEKPQIFVATNGINQTVIKSAVDQIMQTENVMKNIMKDKMTGKALTQNEIQKIVENIMKTVEQSGADIKDISPNKMSYTMIEYYTLIAMSCLYCAMLGMVAINKNLPNMGAMGKRVSVSPVSKMKLIVSSLCAAYVTQLIGIFLLYVVTIFALGVDYGDNIGLVIALSLAGSLAGISLGVAVGTMINRSENTKTGIIISISMLGCFFSGMMGITMKYMVDTNIPILNKINPAAMITDGLYSIYYYGANNRFYIDIVSLLLWSLILIAISFIGLRRQKYDSI